MRTTVSTKGQVVLPAELTEQDRILPGQQFEIERVQQGEYLLKKVGAPSIDMLDWCERPPGPRLTPLLVWRAVFPLSHFQEEVDDVSWRGSGKGRVVA